MKITFVCSNGNVPEGWEENYETDANGDPAEIIGALLNRFNASLRPGELPRKLVKIVGSKSTPFKMEHRWEKQNLVTVNDREGMYDRMKCKACEATGKRFGLGHVTLDKKFDKPKFKICPGYDL